MSIVITLDKFQLLNGGAVPPQLDGYITQAEFTSLCSSYKECEGESQCMTCACEVGAFPLSAVLTVLA